MRRQAEGLDMTDDGRPLMKRLPGEVRRGPTVTLTVDGREVEAYLGETIATALLAAGVVAFRSGDRRSDTRAPYCGMGVCFECTVSIEGGSRVRACMTPVRPGLSVRTAAPESA